MVKGYGYIISVSERNGRRKAWECNARNVYRTKRDAQNKIKGVIERNTEAQRKQVGYVNPRVKKVELYVGGDPKQCYW